MPNTCSTHSWISLSRPISEKMVVYKDQTDRQPTIETTRNFSDSNMHESTLHLPLHSGTHVDYPRHALADGKFSHHYSRFPEIATILVVDLTSNTPDFIDLEHVQQLNLEDPVYGNRVTGIFFKTQNRPQSAFNPNYPGLTMNAAIHLGQMPIRYVGTDHLGIERGQPNHESHIALLKKDILIIEGLDLSKVSAGLHRCLLVTQNVEEVEAEPIQVYKLE